VEPLKRFHSNGRLLDCDQSGVLSVVPLGKAPALLANIRLGWKWLAAVNAQVYSVGSIDYRRKKFYSAAPRSD
jgi:hypothetical protein